MQGNAERVGCELGPILAAGLSLSMPEAAQDLGKNVALDLLRPRVSLLPSSYVLCKFEQATLSDSFSGVGSGLSEASCKTPAWCLTSALPSCVSGSDHLAGEQS